ncbi:AbrB/MazE/SpoVT family DNA-binding domain-containing protein [Candidatus Bathyarchaeota archaeon]|nr:AbrB/MazE/SpoVT family DNA-binding domain-containing protein [Candidatus Bathyarchaeota archaeon]
MVQNMELTIKVDRQGRAVLPREVRIALGIDGETEMVCRVVGNRLVLEKFNVDSARKAFAELEEIVPSLELDTVKVEGEEKYVDREYALRKIGV